LDTGGNPTSPARKSRSHGAPSAVEGAGTVMIGMIRRLHDHLGISAEVLIRPSEKEKAP
jgi:hypothetical protein